MSAITGNTLQQPSGPYWYWTELGPERINLNENTVELPPGRYEAFWDIRGNSGDTFQFQIVADDGTVLLDVTRTIPAGEVDDWDKRLFTVRG
ncbi:hypothetical protein [Pseudoduganella chitinolytica]|uniref:Uncharacterized protein n=1 Tax=Pseudoduganella chitinolytica TaxID=34070 RepID=A0ABY8BDW1_9BURK|nr:hypothetical protein [Pseudoduganella chitinolytica]WEF34015.1 hypothetical protein PX653_04365 [Pseudoduganella chitinolytica]